MAIITISTDVPGQIGGVIGGVSPRRVAITTTDNLATITTAGYLNYLITEGYTLYPTDAFDIIYSYNALTQSGIFGMFTVAYANGSYTLTQFLSPGDVTLPVVSGDFAIFDGTTGKIKDGGFSPTNAAKTKVVMANAATVVNHIMVSTDTAGTIGNLAGTAINDGSIQAGRSTVAGSLVSFPATATTGSLALTAVASGGNFAGVVSNASLGQATTWSIPDPGASTASFVLNTGTTTMAAGSRIIVAKVNGTESANAVTASGMSGIITTSSLTTAGAASYAITWTNTFITTTSTILLSIMGGSNNATNNISFTVTAGAGTSTLTIFNNTAATALNGTLLIGYLVV